jgi:hypothetical protein
MSEENVEILRESLESQLAALSAGSTPEDTISEMEKVWDPEVELDASEFDYELLDAGERVVMLLNLRMRGRATGIEMPFGEFAWVSTFRHGLVVRVKLYMSQAEALEAAGLSE